MFWFSGLVCTHTGSCFSGHVYPGPASNVIGMQPRTQLSSAFFIPDEMRNEILGRNETANLVDTNPNSGAVDELPFKWADGD